MKQTILALALIVTTLTAADNPRTFLELNGQVFSSTNGWNLSIATAERGTIGEIDDTDEDDQTLTRLVIPNTPMTFHLKNSTDLVYLHFSTCLAGHWTNRTFQIQQSKQIVAIPDREHRETSAAAQQPARLSNFLIHETTWNPTNGLLTSAAVDFPCGKLRFNSDVP
jgi:hypothetical protein